MILQVPRVGQGVHGEGVLGRPARPEEVDLGAEGEDEVVVGQRLELGEPDRACIEVDPDHAALVDRRVLLPREQVAQGVADGGRLQQAGRELVQQRLEGVVVVAIDEHDLGVGAPELLCGADPGEPAAEDEDAWAVVHVIPPLPGCRPSTSCVLVQLLLAKLKGRLGVRWRITAPRSG
jgi:hypothetical protein